MQYFTKNQKETLETLLKVKKHDTIYEENLWKKVALYQKYLSFFPGISCICVCNSLAMKSCHIGSDIDLFVITKKNRLWTARIFLTLFFTIIGQRKTRSQHAGKFCLSFFLSEEDLDLEKIALENDIYLAYWIETLVPIINRNSTFEHFREQNMWYSAEGNSSPHSSSQKIQKNNFFIGNIIELLLKHLFLPRTKKSFQDLGKPFGVVISDTMLKFHNEDQRKIISQKVLG